MSAYFRDLNPKNGQGLTPFFRHAFQDCRLFRPGALLDPATVGGRFRIALVPLIFTLMTTAYFKMGPAVWIRTNLAHKQVVAAEEAAAQYRTNALAAIEAENEARKLLAEQH